MNAGDNSEIDPDDDARLVQLIPAPGFYASWTMPDHIVAEDKSLRSATFSEPVAAWGLYSDGTVHALVCQGGDVGSNTWLEPTTAREVFYMPDLRCICGTVSDPDSQPIPDDYALVDGCERCLNCGSPIRPLPRWLKQKRPRSHRRSNRASLITSDSRVSGISRDRIKIISALSKGPTTLREVADQIIADPDSMRRFLGTLLRRRIAEFVSDEDARLPQIDRQIRFIEDMSNQKDS